jgi:hypothetical protein
LITGACTKVIQRRVVPARGRGVAGGGDRRLGIHPSGREHRSLNLGCGVLHQAQRPAEHPRQLVRHRRVERAANRGDDRAIIPDA